ncbi:MAG: EAL domain-containing protein, partial [Jaaginema sp. PMC 1078.18]|nr:EAL domain-containing protein [Jaaginema sp. PMC 1078.18]
YFDLLFGINPEIARPILTNYFEASVWPVLLQALQQYQSLTNYELKLQTLAGKPLWGLVSLQLLSTNNELLVIGTFYDITYQKQIEQALQRNSHSLSRLIDRSADVVYRCEEKKPKGDRFWKFEHLSQAVLSLTGYPPEDWLENNHFLLENLIHPDDRSRIITEIALALKQRQNYDVEYRLFPREGKPKWIWERGYGLWSDAGELLAREGSMIDITMRRKIEEENQLLQTLVRTIGQASTFDDALKLTLQVVCQATNWLYGEAWIPNEQDTALLLTQSWYEADCGSLRQFNQYSQDFSFPKGVGLPGQVWLNRKPLWIEDVRGAKKFLRQHLAVTAGLKTSFGVPIIAGDRVMAVLVFFFNESRDLNYHLSDVVSIVASQLGEVCQRKQTEAALRESERRLASLINTTDGIFFKANASKGYPMVYISDGCSQLTGYPAAALIAGNPVSYSEIIHPQDRDRVIKIMGDRVQNQQAYVLEYRIQSCNQGEKWVWEKGHGVYDTTGALIGIEGFITDITERKHNEEALARAETKYRSIFENALEGIFQTTPDGHYLSANPALARIYGYDNVEDLMASLTDIEHQLYVEPQQRHQFIQLMQTHGAVKNFESQIYRRDGTAIWIRESARTVRDVDGTLLYYEGMVEDITEHKQVKEQLHLRAFYDPLTGLPNRALFQSRLADAFDRAQKEESQGIDPPYQFAVLFLDLDRFKLVNDSLGHLVGDRLLINVARRLENCLREHDTVARLGGDEFTILLEDVSNLDTATYIADRINQALNVAFNLDDHEVYIGVSIGIVLSRNLPTDKAAQSHYQNPDDLLRDADTALYRAKSLGKGRYEIFNTQMQQNSTALLQLETDLRQALNRNEFKIAYQPIVDLKTKALIGFEALLRWQHPRHGEIYPKDFLSIAEESGVTVAIARWMLKKACQQLQAFEAQNTAQPLLLHINLSAKQFLQPDLLEQIQAVCTDIAIDCQYLCFDISENLWIKNADATKIRIAQLRQLGVKICIDDFGRGYSCLSDLHSVTIDMFKIDSAFLQDWDGSIGKSEIARSIVMLARNLGAVAIAEGVETEAQRQAMREFGCDRAQGYYFSSALSPEAAQGWITPNFYSSC